MLRRSENESNLDVGGDWKGDSLPEGQGSSERCNRLVAAETFLQLGSERAESRKLQWSNDSGMNRF